MFLNSILQDIELAALTNYFNGLSENGFFTQMILTQAVPARYAVSLLAAKFL
jgi:hypothetical protein